ncbi:hypothetical protein E4T56_gene12854 [Termitomyces sp. T112]|nr:hypothetical protein E4T56_gene12854 [Termitomyces sp. T112]
MSLITSETEPLLARQSNHKQHVPRKARVGPREISRSTRYGILAGIWSATFLSALNATLVPTMLPSISSEFKKFNQASWLGTAYLLATCTFTPLYGRLCNVLGRKGASQVALVFTMLGVLGCGLSRSMEMLIFSRFLSGIGGGGLFTVGSIIVSDMYSIRNRGLAQGMSSVFNGLGMGLGGPVGGMVTDWLGWRWAFLIQIPMFFFSFGLTLHFHHYVTPGKGKSTIDVLKRIDYGGSIMLLCSVAAALIFLSSRYNEGLSWWDSRVLASFVVMVASSISFFLVELFVAKEPVLAPSLLTQKIPVLVGISNFLVAICNFSVNYFYPMWFQTVMSTNAATAGLHLVPNSLSMSLGSVFAGYVMHRTGRYKAINLTFGWFPFIGASLIASLRRDSPAFLTWMGIAPLGFGNAVVLQTMLIALLIHLPESQMAVGTGFGQLFRGLGQVGGVAVASAIFQYRLDSELRHRIIGPDAEEMIRKIRHSSEVVATLPPELQRHARDSYEISLKAVFVFSACSTLLAFLVRAPIPDRNLDERERGPANDTTTITPPDSGSTTPGDSADDSDGRDHVQPTRIRKRRLSTFEPLDGTMDPERRNTF